MYQTMKKNGFQILEQIFYLDLLALALIPEAIAFQSLLELTQKTMLLFNGCCNCICWW